MLDQNALGFLVSKDLGLTNTIIRRINTKGSTIYKALNSLASSFIFHEYDTLNGPLIAKFAEHYCRQNHKMEQFNEITHQFLEAYNLGVLIFRHKEIPTKNEWINNVISHLNTSSPNFKTDLAKIYDDFTSGKLSPINFKFFNYEQQINKIVIENYKNKY